MAANSQSIDYNAVKPTQKDLDFVSRKTGDNWRSLLTNLGVEYKVIQEHLQFNNNNTRNTCFALLVYWLEGNAGEDEPVSCSALCNALRESSLASCASDLEEKLASRYQSSPVLTPETQQSYVFATVADHPSSRPATQGESTSAEFTGDKRSQKIKEIVTMYRTNKDIHLPSIPELEDDFDEIMAVLSEKLSLASPKMIHRLCAKIRMKYRRYIHGVRSAPLPEVPNTAVGLYEFIAEKSTPYEVLLVHHTADVLKFTDLTAALGMYEGRLATHLKTALLSWKRRGITLPSCKDHTHMAVIVSQNPDVVLLSLVVHIKEYLVKMLHLEEALFEGFAEDCTILFFSILTADAVLLSPTVISHLSELKRKFEITHLVVFGYFACDLEQASVEVLSYGDSLKLEQKESKEKSEQLQYELMAAKSEGERLQHELIAAKMKLNLKEKQLLDAQREGDMLKERIVKMAKHKDDVEGASSLKKLGTSEKTLEFPQPPGALYGIAISPTGTIFVSDSRNHRIHVFSRERQHMKTFGQGGSGEGEVKDPRGLAVDSNQLVYVANTGNDRIEVFKKDGSFVKQIGIGQLQRPENVTVKDDCVCVADTSNHRICIFQKGRLAQTVGTRGSGPGQFMNPSAVAFSPDGDMFVTDHKNCRVQVFSSKGQYLREFGGDQLRGPQHIIITSNEEVFIADWGSGHVAIFNTSGDLLHRLYVPCPYGLAVDDNRGLLVTDYDKVHVYN